jgi:hypothetical protein
VVIVLWGYNRDAPLATVVALSCLPVVLAAGLGWRAAGTGKGLPASLLLAGAMIPYAVWLVLTLDHLVFGFPALLGLCDLCLLPILKKRGKAG